MAGGAFRAAVRHTEGVLASGRSMANLMGLAVARGMRGPGVAYLSDPTHASIRRGLDALGFPLRAHPRPTER